MRVSHEYLPLGYRSERIEMLRAARAVTLLRPNQSFVHQCPHMIMCPTVRNVRRLCRGVYGYPRAVDDLIIYFTTSTRPPHKDGFRLQVEGATFKPAPQIVERSCALAEFWGHALTDVGPVFPKGGTAQEPNEIPWRHALDRIWKVGTMARQDAFSPFLQWNVSTPEHRTSDFLPRGVIGGLSDQGHSGAPSQCASSGSSIIPSCA
ncbi:hypothetical protein WDL1P2_00462 (plasmid) [Variovorax sp. WDL1]|nr:hypothetical protein CHC06_06378 [Variovorax sp. B2]PNG49526.1 hypothetical protein CHC07_06435 [Variovorax sp. B4]VTV18834.1 hypothetical protein WDL1P2_00462 [Variovorax sp. WDL1]